MRYAFAAGVFVIAAIFSVGQIIQFYEGAAASQSGHTFLILGVTASIAGILAACVVLWEAIFYPIARVYYERGHWVTGTLALLALLIAIGYTFSGDFESNVTGRADKVAERSAAVDNRATLRSEIAATSAQRNTWKTIVEQGRLSMSRLRELSQRITESNARIDELEKRLAAAPVNASGTPASEFLYEHAGQTVAFWAGVLLFFKLAFPALMRALAWEFALKAAGVIGKEHPKTVRAAPVTAVIPSMWIPAEPEKAKPTAVTAPTQEPPPAEAKEKPAPVTETAAPAEAANDNAVTEAAEELEATPVTAKKPRKKKQIQEIDWSNVTALAPKLRLSRHEDHVTAALDAVIDSGLAGHHLTPAIGRKRVNAILKHKHVKPISQAEYDRWSRERCDVRGVDCESLVGRQLRFKQRAANGKKENTRLGNSAQVSIPA